MSRVERSWIVLEWLLLFTFLGLALWLEVGLLRAAGGGIMLLALGGYLAVLRRPNRDGSMALLGLTLLATSMFAQNLLTGLFFNARLTAYDFVFLLVLSLMLGVFALALVVGQFLPLDSKPRDYPSWARKLLTLTTGTALGTLLLVALLSGIALGGWESGLEDLSLMTAGATLLVAVTLGLSSVSLLPLTGAQLAGLHLPRPYRLISAMLLLGGFPLELLRGNWALWLLTISVFISVFVWLGRIPTSLQLRTNSAS